MVYIGSLKFDDQLKDNTVPLVIFGAGKMCDSLIDDLKNLGVDKKVVGICDNDLSLCGRKMQNIQIYDPATVLKHFPEADFIVYNRYAIKICEQLLENGISRIHLIRR